MSDPGGPAPDLDPYFVPEEEGGKKGSKWVPPGEADVRRDLLPTEAAFRIAGAIGMVLGAAIFVVFAVPVSGMLHEAGEPGGILLEEDWLWRRWVARMAAVLTLCVVAVATSWGLSRLRPWARWPLIVLGAVPPLALLVGLGFRAWGDAPARRELGDVMTLPCVGVFVFPASLAAFRAACGRRGRAVLGRHHAGLVARTPKHSPDFRTALPVGLGLACALLVLYWTLLFLVLSLLAAWGIIRSV